LVFFFSVCLAGEAGLSILSFLSRVKIVEGIFRIESLKVVPDREKEDGSCKESLLDAAPVLRRGDLRSGDGRCIVKR
jgi:hypothetical protein